MRNGFGGSLWIEVLLVVLPCLSDAEDGLEHAKASADAVAKELSSPAGSRYAPATRSASQAGLVALRSRRPAALRLEAVEAQRI